MDERLHVLSVRPGVDVEVFVVTIAAHLAAEGLYAIYLEDDCLYAIAIADAIHVVVSADTYANLAPCGDLFLRVQWQLLNALRAIHHAASSLRKEHHAKGFGRYAVHYPIQVEW